MPGLSPAGRAQPIELGERFIMSEIKAPYGEEREKETIQYKITDESPHSYYATIPNIIDDLNLSVYAYRLYGHIKRVAGSKGSCWQNTISLAQACNMSVGSVVNAKVELQKTVPPLIRIQENEATGLHEIFITDIWKLNHKKYNSTRSPGEHPRSPGERTRSPHERTRSPGELKNLNIKKNPLRIEEEEEGEPNFSQAWKFYMDNINPTPTEHEANKFGDLCDYHSPKWVIQACKIAVENSARKISYIESILQRWKVNGYGSKFKGNGKNKDGKTALELYAEKVGVNVR